MTTLCGQTTEEVEDSPYKQAVTRGPFANVLNPASYKFPKYRNPYNAGSIEDRGCHSPRKSRESHGPLVVRSQTFFRPFRQHLDSTG